MRYDIAYDDGDEESDVEAERVRGEFESGDEAEEVTRRNLGEWEEEDMFDEEPQRRRRRRRRRSRSPRLRSRQLARNRGIGGEARASM